MSFAHITVLGSGVMGSGIAAHAANAGARVTLLDIVPKDAQDRNMLTKKALERMLSSPSSPFLSPERANSITCGNLEDDLHLLKDADWIIEAVIERKDIKQDVYKKVDQYRKKDSVISSNTSTIPLHELLEGLPTHIAQDFCITHFFNPPRTMRLLEVVKSPSMSSKTFEAACEFADIHLGKTIVPCKDTPGFIANRIGVFWMTAGLNAALDLGVSVEEADAVIGKPVGIPSTGIFGLYDLIGLDLMRLIAHEMHATLPANDPFRALNAEPTILTKLIEGGYTGRKGKGGFTRINKNGAQKIKETLNLTTGEYAPEQPITLGSAKAKNIKELLRLQDKGAAYAWRVMSQTLLYAASLIPEIADDIAHVDTAMKSGYSWKFGPFELIDQIGVDHFIQRAEQDGHPIPDILRKASGKSLYKIEKTPQQIGLNGIYKPVEEPKGVILLADIKRAQKPIISSPSASLWDVGDGIACFELTTKMNVWDTEGFDMLEQSIAKVESDFKGLVIGTDSETFSAGANLQFFLNAAESGNFAAIEALIKCGQQVFSSLKYARKPSVAALAGIALGGGCETALACSAVQAHAESYPGLVEVNVGLIPAWRGCTEMLVRFGEPKTPYNLILSAKTATSSDDAKTMRILNTQSGVTMNRLRLLADAKARCLKLAEAYTPTKALTISLQTSANAELEALLEAKQAEGKLAPHTAFIGKILAEILSTSGTEQAVLDAEREGFMELIKTKASQERIAHMLKTNKPLQN